MKTVVTGGKGFIGSRIAKMLNSKIIDKPEYDLTKLSIEEITELFRGAEEVYHCAAVLGTSELNKNPELAWQENVINTDKVFKSTNKKIFFPSKPLVWDDVYTKTKKECERIAPSNVKIIRGFNVFGPGQKDKMLPLFINMAMNNKPIRVYGNGNQLVDMIYVDDFARISIDFLRSDYNGTVECGGYKISVLKVAEMVNEYFNGKGIEFLPMRDGEGSQPVIADNSIIQKIIEIKLTPFEEAMNKTFESYNKSSSDSCP